MNVSNKEIQVNGKWVPASNEDWESFHGRRRLQIANWDHSEYHGPVRVNGVISREKRECRCSVCTMFELDAELHPVIEQAIRSMLG